MDFNLVNYLKIYPALSDDVCTAVVKKLSSQDVKWEKHVYSDPVTHESVSYENELSVGYIEPSTELRNTVMQNIWDSYMAYITELNFEWFDKWAAFTEVRFNKYENNTLMRKHCDHIHSIFDGVRKGVPILTALGSLNKEYEGGKLIFWDDTEIIIPPGHIAVFPSNFLYPHYVTPVKEGVRYSFVAWAW